MTSTSFEQANPISGRSKLYPAKKFAEHFSSLNLIEIPDLVARKFDLKEGDCLIWHYYADKKAAIVTKREGWKSRKAKLSGVKK